MLCGLFYMAMRGLLAVLAFAVGAAGAPSLSSDALPKGVLSTPSSEVRLSRRRAGGEVIRTGNITFEQSLHRRFFASNDVSLLASAPSPLGGPLPLPDSFSWENKDGHNYLAESYNQHIPQ